MKVLGISGKERHAAAAVSIDGAVRTVFLSAIDAQVIGGFLLMKDYWLLRSTVDA